MTDTTTGTTSHTDMVIDALGDEQVERYFATTDRGRAAAALRAERRADLDGDHPAQPAELIEAEQASAAAAPVARTLGTVLTTLFMLTGWGFLLMGGVGIVLGLLDGARNPFTGRWRFTGAASVLVIGSAACLALACLLWAVREAAEAHVDRAREKVLVAWAVERPGQLGRGIPALRTDPGSGVVLVPLVRVVAVLLGILGVFLTPVAAVAAVISLVTLDWDFLLAMLGLTAAGLVAATLAWLLWRATGVLRSRDLRRRRALAGRFVADQDAAQQ